MNDISIKKNKTRCYTAQKFKELTIIKCQKKKYPGPNLERAQGKIIPNPSHFITNNLDIRLPSVFSSLYTYGRWG